MGKCPYCARELHIEDFFEVSTKETKKRKIKVRIGAFEGEYMDLGFRHKVKMWCCPFCESVLGFSEYRWSRR